LDSARLLRCHHRAAPKARDPVIQRFSEKLDRPVKPGDDTVCFARAGFQSVPKDNGVFG
jgi:hypothetical protein